MIDNGSSDNCGIDTMWVSPETLSCSGIGSTETVYSKEIVSTDGYTVNIEISELEVTVLTSCPDTWYNYEVQYNYSISFSGTSIPPSGLWNLSLNFDCTQDLSGDLPNNGGIGSDQTYLATRSESDCGTVTFNDLNCNSLSVNIDGPGITSQTVTLDEIAPSNSSVTLNVKDKSGNIGTCETAITLIDTISPTITCPGEIILSVDPGSCVATGVSLGMPTTSDNCAIDAVINDAPASFPIGTTVVTWTVSDVSGNSNTCTQNVTIVPEEDIDIEVLDLAALCQSGQTGTTTVSWTIKHNAGTTDWTYDYTINDGTNDVASATGVSATGDITISYIANNSASDKTYTLTLNNVKDDCGILDTQGSAKTDAVMVHAVPATGEIIPD